VLLAIQSVIFWLVIPAAFSLVRAESGSERVALSAAMLVPLMPLGWPLVWNDFRELQLALPFVLWAIQGWRGRDPRLASVAIAGMLACRQEYAFVVASMSLLPARDAEDAATRRRWAAGAFCFFEAPPLEPTEARLTAPASAAGCGSTGAGPRFGGTI